MSAERQCDSLGMPRLCRVEEEGGRIPGYRICYYQQRRMWTAFARSSSSDESPVTSRSRFPHTIDFPPLIHGTSTSEGGVIFLTPSRGLRRSIEEDSFEPRVEKQNAMSWLARVSSALGVKVVVAESAAADVQRRAVHPPATGK